MPKEPGRTLSSIHHLFWQAFEFDKGTKRTFVRPTPRAEFFVLLKIGRIKNKAFPRPQSARTLTTIMLTDC